MAVVLSERGPERFSVPGSGRQVFVCGVEVGGGESKDLLVTVFYGSCFYGLLISTLFTAVILSERGPKRSSVWGW